MEDAAEYLINPGQFIMSPEYIYTDIEKRQIYFCMMPGYEKDIKEQFQLLTDFCIYFFFLLAGTGIISSTTEAS